MLSSIARDSLSVMRLPIESAIAPLHCLQIQLTRSCKISARANAARWARKLRTRASCLSDYFLSLRELPSRFCATSEKKDRMRIRMIPYLMTGRDNVLSDARKFLDIFANHEKRRLHFQLFQHVEQLFRVFARPIIKSQRHFVG